MAGPQRRKKNSKPKVKIKRRRKTGTRAKKTPPSKKTETREERVERCRHAVTTKTRPPNNQKKTDKRKMRKNEKLDKLNRLPILTRSMTRKYRDLLNDPSTTVSEASLIMFNMSRQSQNPASRQTPDEQLGQEKLLAECTYDVQSQLEVETYGLFKDMEAQSRSNNNEFSQSIPQINSLPLFNDQSPYESPNTPRLIKRNENLSQKGYDSSNVSSENEQYLSEALPLEPVCKPPNTTEILINDDKVITQHQKDLELSLKHLRSVLHNKDTPGLELDKFKRLNVEPLAETSLNIYSHRYYFNTKERQPSPDRNKITINEANRVQKQNYNIPMQGSRDFSSNDGDLLHFRNELRLPSFGQTPYISWGNVNDHSMETETNNSQAEITDDS